MNGYALPPPPSEIDLLRRSIARAGAAGEVPILHGNTGDLFPLSDRQAVRLPGLVAMTHDAQGRAPVLFSPGGGSRQYPLPGREPVPLRLPPRDLDPVEAVVGLVEEVRSSDRPIALIVDYADLLCPASPPGTPVEPRLAAVIECFQRAATDPAFFGGGHAVVLIERSTELHPSLRYGPGFQLIRVPGPDEAALAMAFELLLARSRESPGRFGVLADGVDPLTAARQSCGLAIDDVVRLSREAAHEGVALTLDRLSARRGAAIERLAPDVLTLIPSLGPDDVAGVPHVRRYLQEHTVSGEWPAAVVLGGPFGTGKTWVAQGIAGTLDRLLLRWLHQRSMWIGETDRRTTLGYETLRDLRPVVVHHDEADAEFGRRGGPSGDSGTSQRILAAFLSATGGLIDGQLFVLTTNWPDLLEPAVLDRSDVIPILHSTASEIAELLPVLARQLGRELREDVDCLALGATLEQTLATPRALIHMLRRAATISDVESGARGSPIRQHHVRRAIADFLPDSDPLQEEYVGLKSVAACRSKDLLPWVATREVCGRDEVLPYIRPLLDDAGELDRDKLVRRIVELEVEPVVRAMRQGL